MMMDYEKNLDAAGGSQMKISSNSTATQSSILFHIVKVKYHNQLIKIFSNSLEKKPLQFFFEPLIHLDPKTIMTMSHSRESVKQNILQFTIQMWNDELRLKVLERLRSLETFQNVKIGEEDVCVIPFEEVQLICKSGGLPQSIKLDEKPTSYLRSDENLNFYLLYSASAIDEIDQFQKNPQFTLNDWQLQLECRGVSIDSWLTPAGSTSLQRPSFAFNISVLPNNERTSKLLLCNHVFFTVLKFIFVFLKLSLLQLI